MLIGSRKADSRSEKVKDLDARIAKDEDSSSWRVRDITTVLDRAELEHKELIDIYRRVEAESEDLADTSGNASPQ